MRESRYAAQGQHIDDPAGIIWFVAVDPATDAILACAALAPNKYGEGSRDLLDVLGDELQAVDALFQGVCNLAKKMAWELFIWMPIAGQSRIAYAMQRGFVPTSLRLKLPLQVDQENTG